MSRGRSTRIAGALGCTALIALSGGGPAQARTVNDPGFSRQWGLGKIGAPTAWDTATGAGTVIAVVDSGVDRAHEDLSAKLLPGQDFSGSGSVQDDCGHGTHVSGIAAAITNNGRGVAGVAPDAKIMPLKALSGDDCSGTERAVSDAIRFAADRGATVINLSLGSDVQFLTGSGFGEALDYAWSKGSIPVVAAGNQFLLGSGYVDEPAIVVTATGRTDNKPSYSSTSGGARWAMSAPGGNGSGNDNDILSSYYVPGKANSYALLAGTSMATPHVAGAAAVLRSMGLTPQQTVDRLLSTSTDLGDPGKDSTFGSGRLDLAKAVSLGGGAGFGGTPTTKPGAGPTTTTRAPASTGRPTTTRPGSTSSRRGVRTNPSGTVSDPAPGGGDVTSAPDIVAPPTTDAPLGDALPPPKIVLDIEDGGSGSGSGDPPGPLVAFAALGLLAAGGGTALSARSFLGRRPG